MRHETIELIAKANKALLKDAERQSLSGSLNDWLLRGDNCNLERLLKYHLIVNDKSISTEEVEGIVKKYFDSVVMRGIREGRVEINSLEDLNGLCAEFLSFGVLKVAARQEQEGKKRSAAEDKERDAQIKETSKLRKSLDELVRVYGDDANHPQRYKLQGHAITLADGTKGSRSYRVEKEDKGKKTIYHIFSEDKDNEGFVVGNSKKHTSIVFEDNVKTKGFVGKDNAYSTVVNGKELEEIDSLSQVQETDIQGYDNISENFSENDLQNSLLNDESDNMTLGEEKVEESQPSSRELGTFSQGLSNIATRLFVDNYEESLVISGLEANRDGDQISLASLRGDVDEWQGNHDLSDLTEISISQNGANRLGAYKALIADIDRGRKWVEVSNKSNNDDLKTRLEAIVGKSVGVGGYGIGVAGEVTFSSGPANIDVIGDVQDCSYTIKTSGSSLVGNLSFDIERQVKPAEGDAVQREYSKLVFKPGKTARGYSFLDARNDARLVPVEEGQRLFFIDILLPEIERIKEIEAENRAQKAASEPLEKVLEKMYKGGKVVAGQQYREFSRLQGLVDGLPDNTLETSTFRITKTEPSAANGNKTSYVVEKIIYGADNQEQGITSFSKVVFEPNRKTRGYFEKEEENLDDRWLQDLTQDNNNTNTGINTFLNEFTPIADKTRKSTIDIQEKSQNITDLTKNLEELVKLHSDEKTRKKLENLPTQDANVVGTYSYEVRKISPNESNDQTTTYNIKRVHKDVIVDVVPDDDRYYRLVLQKGQKAIGFVESVAMDEDARELNDDQVQELSNFVSGIKVAKDADKTASEQQKQALKDKLAALLDGENDKVIDVKKHDGSSLRYKISKRKTSDVYELERVDVSDAGVESAANTTHSLFDFSGGRIKGYLSQNSKSANYDYVTSAEIAGYSALLTTFETASLQSNLQGLVRDGEVKVIGEGDQAVTISRGNDEIGKKRRAFKALSALGGDLNNVFGNDGLLQNHDNLGVPYADLNAAKAAVMVLDENDSALGGYRIKERKAAFRALVDLVGVDRNGNFNVANIPDDVSDRLKQGLAATNLTTAKNNLGIISSERFRIQANGGQHKHLSFDVDNDNAVLNHYVQNVDNDENFDLARVRAHDVNAVSDLFAGSKKHLDAYKAQVEDKIRTESEEKLRKYLDNLAERYEEDQNSLRRVQVLNADGTVDAAGGTNTYEVHREKEGGKTVYNIKKKHYNPGTNNDDAPDATYYSKIVFEEGRKVQGFREKTLDQVSAGEAKVVDLTVDNDAVKGIDNFIGDVKPVYKDKESARSERKQEELKFNRQLKARLLQLVEEPKVAGKTSNEFTVTNPNDGAVQTYSVERDPSVTGSDVTFNLTVTSSALGINAHACRITFDKKGEMKGYVENNVPDLATYVFPALTPINAANKQEFSNFVGHFQTANLQSNLQALVRDGEVKVIGEGNAAVTISRGNDEISKKRRAFKALSALGGDLNNVFGNDGLLQNHDNLGVPYADLNAAKAAVMVLDENDPTISATYNVKARKAAFRALVDLCGPNTNGADFKLKQGLDGRGGDATLLTTAKNTLDRISSEEFYISDPNNHGVNAGERHSKFKFENHQESRLRQSIINSNNPNQPFEAAHNFNNALGYEDVGPVTQLFGRVPQYLDGNKQEVKNKKGAADPLRESLEKLNSKFTTHPAKLERLPILDAHGNIDAKAGTDTYLVEKLEGHAGGLPDGTVQYTITKRRSVANGSLPDVVTHSRYFFDAEGVVKGRDNIAAADLGNAENQYGGLPPLAVNGVKGNLSEIAKIEDRSDRIDTTIKDIVTEGTTLRNKLFKSEEERKEARAAGLVARKEDLIEALVAADLTPTKDQIKNSIDRIMAAANSVPSISGARESIIAHELIDGNTAPVVGVAATRGLAEEVSGAVGILETVKDAAKTFAPAVGQTDINAQAIATQINAALSVNPNPPSADQIKMALKLGLVEIDNVDRFDGMEHVRRDKAVNVLGLDNDRKNLIKSIWTQAAYELKQERKTATQKNTEWYDRSIGLPEFSGKNKDLNSIVRDYVEQVVHSLPFDAAADKIAKALKDNKSELTTVLVKNGHYEIDGLSAKAKGEVLDALKGNAIGEIVHEIRPSVTTDDVQKEIGADVGATNSLAKLVQDEIPNAKSTGLSLVTKVKDKVTAVKDMRDKVAPAASSFVDSIASAKTSIVNRFSKSEASKSEDQTLSSEEPKERKRKLSPREEERDRREQEELEMLKKAASEMKDVMDKGMGGFNVRGRIFGKSVVSGKDGSKITFERKTINDKEKGDKVEYFITKTSESGKNLYSKLVFDKDGDFFGGYKDKATKEPQGGITAEQVKQLQFEYDCFSKGENIRYGGTKSDQKNLDSSVYVMRKFLDDKIKEGSDSSKIYSITERGKESNLNITRKTENIGTVYSIYKTSGDGNSEVISKLVFDQKTGKFKEGFKDKTQEGISSGLLKSDSDSSKKFKDIRSEIERFEKAAKVQKTSEVKVLKSELDKLVKKGSIRIKDVDDNGKVKEGDDEISYEVSKKDNKYIFKKTDHSNGEDKTTYIDINIDGDQVTRSVGEGVKTDERLLTLDEISNLRKRVEMINKAPLSSKKSFEVGKDSTDGDPSLRVSERSSKAQDDRVSTVKKRESEETQKSEKQKPVISLEPWDNDKELKDGDIKIGYKVIGVTLKEAEGVSFFRSGFAKSDLSGVVNNGAIFRSCAFGKGCKFGGDLSKLSPDNFTGCRFHESLFKDMSDKDKENFMKKFEIEGGPNEGGFYSMIIPKKSVEFPKAVHFEDDRRVVPSGRMSHAQRLMSRDQTGQTRH